MGGVPLLSKILPQVSIFTEISHIPDISQLWLEMICFTFSFAVSYGTTVSACREDACATFFTFAHELGHNFGATHGYHHHFLNCFNVLNVSRLRPDNQISLESNQCASCCQKYLHLEIFEAILVHFKQTVLFFFPTLPDVPPYIYVPTVLHPSIPSIPPSKIHPSI